MDQRGVCFYVFPTPTRRVSSTTVIGNSFHSTILSPDFSSPSSLSWPNGHRQRHRREKNRADLLMGINEDNTREGNVLLSLFFVYSDQYFGCGLPQYTLNYVVLPAVLQLYSRSAAEMSACKQTGCLLACDRNKFSQAPGLKACQ